ncbi:M55 family metallopeptidase [Sporosarcina gallistercoris]|uniref:M55 family metallopeptidase n=1 Tax=Sporosarcina gallistercoris TaxID=2762245 RepID=A0ABR8PLI7_9BACL|nr:M55 family metallopeptidase [Sporosarcina gallistercoris]MBD7909041.1 M55 family metallopeptidase [Sporosarcina gallistercoris]
MKIYISADIEGVAGVVHAEHTLRDGKEHDYARKLMTDEVNACIRGALEAGAVEIVVNDSHGTMRNIYPEQLHSEARLLMGSPKKLAMMEGITSDYDAALFVGYHTRAGSNGILNHTFSGKVIRTIRVNSVEMGEFGLNALVAGYYDVPTVFVSGCNLLAEEAKAVIPEIETVIVKETISRTAALNLSPSEAKARIQQGAKRSLEHIGGQIPFAMDGPFAVEIEFLNTGYADAVEIVPIYERSNPLTVSFTNDDWLHCYRLIRGAIMIANSVQ